MIIANLSALGMSDGKQAEHLSKMLKQVGRDVVAQEIYSAIVSQFNDQTECVDTYLYNPSAEDLSNNIVFGIEDPKTVTETAARWNEKIQQQTLDAIKNALPELEQGVMVRLTPYEAYQLRWMLEHGYSLTNLIEELTGCQFAAPEDSDTISAPISETFDSWERDVGFGGEIWASEREFNEVEGAEKGKTPSLQPKDICLYSFGTENGSASIVEIVRLLDTSECAVIRVLKVIEDDSGNGYFSYLQRSGQTMNASLKYLQKLDPQPTKLRISQ